jgi:oligopeptide/dipeptide ABC transporter ATP-binding protein
MTATTPLLETRGLQVWYPVRGGMRWRPKGYVRAVDGVDLSVMPGETLGLVGESGCGKSTLGRAIMRLQRKTGGDILFDGKDVSGASGAARRALKRQMQIIFQDSAGSFNPRLRVRDIVGEGLKVHGVGDREARAEMVGEMLERVGLSRDMANRYPHEFSGGQRQRIGIARGLVLKPRLVVADEPVSALDVSIQSQVLNLLVDFKKHLNLSYVFVAHNLAVVSYISDRIAVMYLGRVVELGPTEAIYQNPQHPYTVSLLSAIPRIGSDRSRSRVMLKGDPPSPMNPPSGCRFHLRCPIARMHCSKEEPVLANAGTTAGHAAACHYPGEMEALNRSGAAPAPVA